MQFKITPVVFSILLLVGCGGGGSGPDSTTIPVQNNPAPKDISCADYFEYSVPPVRYVNNVWNKQAANGYPYVQCIRQQGYSNARQYGWRWQWPINSTTVFSYPAVVMGWKPWNGGQSSVAALPIKINNISKFTWSYDVATASNSKYNLSTSLWLTSNGTTYNNPTSTYITTEFMIWSTGYGFRPAGTLKGYIDIDGTTFEVWHNPAQTDASNQNTNVWKYIAYRAVSPIPTATLDIKKFLNDAVNRGLLDSNEYVSSLEMGNEIMSGIGETWIRSLALDVQ